MNQVVVRSHRSVSARLHGVATRWTQRSVTNEISEHFQSTRRQVFLFCFLTFHSFVKYFISVIYFPYQILSGIHQEM